MAPVNKGVAAEHELVRRAAALSRHNPTLWNDFVTAMAQFSTHQSDVLLRSPLEELPRLQGRAQNAAQVLDLLANCLQYADKMEGKQ